MRLVLINRSTLFSIKIHIYSSVKTDIVLLSLFLHIYPYGNVLYGKYYIVFTVFVTFIGKVHRYETSAKCRYICPTCYLW